MSESINRVIQKTIKFNFWEIPIFLIYFDTNFEIVYLIFEPVYKYFFFRMATVRGQVSTDGPRHGSFPNITTGWSIK